MSPDFGIPRNWRLQKQRYALVGEICPDGHHIFPPRDICPDCGIETNEHYKFSGKGEVYSYHPIYDAPEGFHEQAPYVIALIKLEEGPMLTAQLTDLQFHWENGKKIYHVETGMPVEMVTRKIKEAGGERGPFVYGYKFRPPISQVESI